MIAKLKGVRKMAIPIFERFRTGLLEKRNNLTNWLQNTPLDMRDINLGPENVRSIQDHLHTIDHAIEEAEQENLGRCRVCQDFIEPELLETDYTVEVCFEHLSREEIHNLESELELAQHIQKTLLPSTAPNVYGLDIAAYSRPAQIVGGDYFDFIPFQDGAFGFMIADVAGHGVSASLHMASIQALMHAIVPTSSSPADVAHQIHQLFVHNIHYTTFVTLFIAALDLNSKQLTFCNAGHNPPLVYRRQPDEKFSSYWLMPTGAAVGLIEDAQYRESRIDLEAGDVLLFYTDGVTEAVNDANEEFGRARLVDLVGRKHDLPAKEMLQEIRQGLEAYIQSRTLADDTTMVLCRLGSSLQ
jgi:serine phosphatase RsbU (regulator of sigma subunit)